MLPGLAHIYSLGWRGRACVTPQAEEFERQHQRESKFPVCNSKYWVIHLWWGFRFHQEILYFFLSSYQAGERWAVWLLAARELQLPASHKERVGIYLIGTVAERKHFSNCSQGADNLRSLYHTHTCQFRHETIILLASIGVWEETGVTTYPESTTGRTYKLHANSVDIEPRTTMLEGRSANH